MKRNVLFAFAAILIVSLSAVIISGEVSDGDSQSSLLASYSEGIVCIEGHFPEGYSGGHVTFRLIDPEGYVLADAYSEASRGDDYSCSFVANGLQDGSYIVEASYTVPGKSVLKEIIPLEVGMPSAIVTVHYDGNILTICGEAPDGYASGTYTCHISSEEGVISHAYGMVGSDGLFSLSLSVVGLESGDYWIWSYFDIIGERTVSHITQVSLDIQEGKYGDYSLVVDSIHESEGSITVDYRSGLKGESEDSYSNYSLSFEMGDDGSLSIVGFTSSTDTVLLIPDVVTIDEKDHPVTSMGQDAFQNNTHIVGVIFPLDMDIDIPANAFRKDVNLSFVRFSNDTEIIADYAFSNAALKEVLLPAHLVTIGSNVFGGNPGLKSVSSDPDASGLKKSAHFKKLARDI